MLKNNVLCVVSPRSPRDWGYISYNKNFMHEKARKKIYMSKVTNLLEVLEKILVSTNKFSRLTAKSLGELLENSWRNRRSLGESLGENPWACLITSRRNTIDPEENRMQFIATFGRIDLRDRRRGQRIKSLLIHHVREAQGKQFVIDHLWLRPDKPFDHLQLKYGDGIMFDAHITPYVHRNGKKDYRLGNPLTIEAISRYIPKTSN